jgi:lysophospholipid acyltransferase (LPLAT)-like uncharacterized protein
MADEVGRAWQFAYDQNGNVTRTTGGPRGSVHEAELGIIATGRRNTPRMT